MRVVLCNVPPDQAAPIASALVEQQLAACVTATQVTSTYRWDGAVHHDPEVSLTIKVAEHGLERLRDALLALHPYDCPEVVVLGVDVQASHGAYVDWVRASTGGPPTRPQ